MNNGIVHAVLKSQIAAVLLRQVSVYCADFLLANVFGYL
jgi:hypothetical protein